jgi:hypothetical protein
MKNTTELRTQLVDVFTKLKTRKIDVTTAKALIGVSNSILKSASSEADYNKFIGAKSPIQFLETPVSKKTR